MNNSARSQPNRLCRQGGEDFRGGSPPGWPWVCQHLSAPPLLCYPPPPTTTTAIPFLRQPSQPLLPGSPLGSPQGRPPVSSPDPQSSPLVSWALSIAMLRTEVPRGHRGSLISSRLPGKHHPMSPQLSALPALGDAVLLYGPDPWLTLFYLRNPQRLPCVSIAPAPGRLGWLETQT